MATSYMGGKVDVSLNGITIPATLISDEGVTTTLTEGTREIATMGGTFTQASGTYDESTVVFNVVLPNMNYLGVLFPDQYTASTDRPTIAGQTIFGGDSCSVRANTPLVVHYTCDPNSDNDVFIPNGAVLASIDLKLLVAKLFALVGTMNTTNGNIKSKRVEDFTITFNDNTVFDQFLLDNSATINKYSICSIGDVQNGDVCTNRIHDDYRI